MLIELRQKSQLTLPKEIVKELNLNKGDQLDISISDGNIKITPVAVYPKSYIDKLQEEYTILKRSIDNGEVPSFDNVDDLLKKLEED